MTTHEATATIRAYAEADLLLLAASMLAPPSAVESGDDEEVFPALLAALAPQAPLDALLSQSRVQWAHALHESGPDAPLEEHARLFEGAQACPMNEGAYLRRDKGAILADIAGFHRAFGFGARAGVSERVDHLACELEFVAMLLVMAARAAEAGHAEHREITEDAAASFAADHLGEWIDGFCARLFTTTRHPAYRAVATFVGSAWAVVRANHGWPEPQGTEPELDTAEGTPYECGMADRGLA